MSDPARVAASDQACAESRDDALFVGTFYNTLRGMEVPALLAGRLTERWMDAWLGAEDWEEVE